MKLKNILKKSLKFVLVISPAFALLTSCKNNVVYNINNEIESLPLSFTPAEKRKIKKEIIQLNNEINSDITSYNNLFLEFDSLNLSLQNNLTLMSNQSDSANSYELKYQEAEKAFVDSYNLLLSSSLANSSRGVKLLTKLKNEIDSITPDEYDFSDPEFVEAINKTISNLKEYKQIKSSQDNFNHIIKKLNSEKLEYETLIKENINNIARKRNEIKQKMISLINQANIFLEVSSDEEIEVILRNIYVLESNLKDIPNLSLSALKVNENTTIINTFNHKTNF